MSGTPPEAKVEYSRATEDSEGVGIHSERPRWRTGVAVPTAVLTGGILGSALLIASEFTTLYAIHTSAARAAIQTVSGHSHNDYAFIPMALLALVLTFAAARRGSRPALLALGLVGVISLVIAIAGDLPDSRASGLIGSPQTHYTAASSSAGLGLYLETAGAVVLILTCGAGFLLGGPQQQSPPPGRDGTRSPH
jgi:hypothetical protein